MNTVCLTGNITRDCDVRNTPATSIITFTLAVNERVKGQNGWEDRPSYIDCVKFDKTGNVAAYLTKGAKIAVDGRIRQSAWEKDGQKRSKLEVIVSNIDFMSKKQEPTYEMPLYESDCPF